MSFEDRVYSAGTNFSFFNGRTDIHACPAAWGLSYTFDKQTQKIEQAVPLSGNFNGKSNGPRKTNTFFGLHI